VCGRLPPLRRLLSKHGPLKEELYATAFKAQNPREESLKASRA
jgi:hypothetical protein